MSKPFTASRADGRSDRRVVFELVQNAEPDTLFTFDQLATALNQGLENPVSRARIGAATRAAHPTLLREQQRGLKTVKGLGYRILSASEHLPVAIERKGSATRQFTRGYVMLKECRLDELTDTQRKLHEGNQLIMGAFLGALRHLNMRQNQQESVLQSLIKRVERLEPKQS